MKLRPIGRVQSPFKCVDDVPRDCGSLVCYTLHTFTFLVALLRSRSFLAGVDAHQQS